MAYHYVRPITGSQFPSLKALDVDDFRHQLEYFRRYYTFVGMDDIVGALDDGRPLPARPLLLTFDDGYADHYTYVWPTLLALGVTAAFYPTAESTYGRGLLAVNKIHFVLAAANDHEALVQIIEAAIRDFDARGGGSTVAEYRSRYWQANRFDAEPTLYCKQLLQHALPDGLRQTVLDDLFQRFVTSDPAGFAADLYLNAHQIREMRASGMHIGGHGGTHRWLDRLSRDEQRAEIDESIRLLEVTGMTPSDTFTFCYPYGGYNDVTLDLLRERRCRAAVTVRPDLATSDPITRLELPRLDTNDLPKDPAAPIGAWTLRVLDTTARATSLDATNPPDALCLSPR